MKLISRQFVKDTRADAWQEVKQQLTFPTVGLYMKHRIHDRVANALDVSDVAFRITGTWMSNVI